MANTITLLTDYGNRDSFVAAMKGVIIRTNPEARIIDITHEIAPQDIWESAFTLAGAYQHFPKGTIHLAVVDPGVGSGRRPIIVVTESYYFVGPDNGLFSLIYQDAERLRVHHITAGHYFIANPGPTFHGRDVFAPVAAWLSKGIPSGNFGEEVTNFVRLNVPAVKRNDAGIEGHVVHIDRFGNLITNITFKDLQPFLPEDGGTGAAVVSVGGREIRGLKRFYAEAAPGEPGAIINSNGHLEIFLFRQNARTTLGIKRGEAVRISPLPSA
jgi:S-adenosyl-L-methionine hydrolase (adenosine-forming)